MNRDLGVGLPPLDPSEDAPPFREKRRHRRRQLAVRCWMADGKSTVYARLHDVSMSGLSVRAPVPFTKDAELELALVLPSGDLGDPNGTVAVRARGRVIWVRAEEGGPRMGAQFIDVESGAEALMAIVE